MAARSVFTLGDLRFVTSTLGLKESSTLGLEVSSTLGLGACKLPRRSRYQIIKDLGPKSHNNHGL